MNGIKLQRSIEVRCWRVIGQVARAAKRPELMPVLLHARERGSVDAGDIAGHLLFETGSRRMVAQRLLEIAELYGLLEETDRRYSLTESGRTTLDTKQTFVPEHGTWTIWVSDDPLLATPILRIEPWVEPTAYAEVWGDERDSADERLFQELPGWVRDAVGVVSVPVVGGAPLRIDQLEPDGEAADPETLLRAVWDVSAGRLTVDGTLGGARVSTVLDAPAVGADTVWMQLLQAEGQWSQWDPKELALRAGFEETTEDERESLVRSVVFRRPHIAELGVFDPTKVNGVPLRAQSANDASRWAEWRLRARIRDYATAERFSAWTEEAAAPFSAFQPSMPTRHALAEAAWRSRTDQQPSGAWHLVSAEDWSL